MDQASIIVSVPHSGTRFLMERLGIDIHAHTSWSWERLIKTIGVRRLIVPLRDPVSVWTSWARRSSRDVFPFAEFFFAWAGLHTLDTMFSLDVICIDKQSDPRITDWSPVGNTQVARFESFPADLRAVYSLPIVKRYYEYDGTARPFNPYHRGDRLRRYLANETVQV